MNINKKPLILIVDDNPINLQILGRLLRADYDTAIAMNGKEALAFIERRLPDLILLDIMMPVMDGFEACRKLKLHKDARETPVIFLTARTDVEGVVKGFDLGAVDYIVKPFRKEELLARVSTHLKLKASEASLKVLNDRLEKLVKERTGELSESEARFRTFFEESKDAILITEPGGKIFKINQAGLDLLGYGTAEIAGMDLLDLFAFDDEKDRVLREMENAGYIGNHEVKFRRKGNELLDCRITANRRDDLSGGYIYQAIIRDVTELKRLESIAEAANLMDNIGYVFSGIRHELGNPINSIKVTLGLLKKGLEQYSIDVIRQLVERSIAEIGRVEFLLKSLRNFNMFEKPELHDIDVSSFLKGFVSIISEDIQKKGIELKTECADSTGAMHVDPRAFQQVLLNIITNAVDAVGESPMPMISLTADRRHDYVRFVVEDNGCGISDDYRAKIFDPFFTTKPSGTGLGLVIVKNMLAKMSSSINIESEPNKGARIIISVPAARKDEKDRAAVNKQIPAA